MSKGEERRLKSKRGPRSKGEVRELTRVKEVPAVIGIHFGYLPY